MPGFHKVQRDRRQHGRRFPASRYDDPRGGRASGLERNVLRYRAIEASLYLFYTEEVRDFLLSTVYPASTKSPTDSPWATSRERRLEQTFRRLLMDAELSGRLPVEDAEQLRLQLSYDRQQSKKLRAAFRHAIEIGVFTQAEAEELQELLDYRNDIAHRLQLVLADVSRDYWTVDQLAFRPPIYKGDALDKLRAYRKSLWSRTGDKLILRAGFERLTFEFAEGVFEEDLRRLERKIQAQIRAEKKKWDALRPELDLTGTEFQGDLDPRFPPNHRPSRTYGDDYVPATGHLTRRGVEICYRLFDSGRSPLAVSYLMGMTLRSAERRRRSWLKVGGPSRQRAEVRRYPTGPRAKAPQPA